MPKAPVARSCCRTHPAAPGVARVRRSATGAPFLFLTTHESFEKLLATGTLPTDDYQLAPFTPRDVAVRLRWLTRTGSAALATPTLRPRPLLARRGEDRIPLAKTQRAVCIC